MESSSEMSLTDRTTETIWLSLHRPMLSEDGRILHHAQLNVDLDIDSSNIPPYWVDISLSDAEHDADTIKLSFTEAGLLYDRLGLILGRNRTEKAA